MEAIMYIGLIVTFGVIVGHIMSRLNVPSIAGYVIAGIIVGPSVFDLIPQEVVSAFGPVTDIALAFLAFGVGTELFFPKLKDTGLSLALISLTEVLLTFLLVSGVLLLFDMNIYMALLLGALASSTSPAPIMLLKKQFGSKSVLVDDAIAICAVDDALGIIVFGVVKSIASSGYSSSEKLNFVEMIEPAIVELAISTFFGIIVGLSLGFLINKFGKKKSGEQDMEFYLEVTFVSVVLSLAFAYLFKGSTILLPLITGVAFTNVVGKDVFDLETKVVDLFALPFLIIFFTVAGIQINVRAIQAVWLLSIVYVVFRAVGKYLGGIIGGKLSRHKAKYGRQVGLMLLPLGGIEIGLALSAQEVFNKQDGNIVKLIVLSGTLVFSIFGTFIVSSSLDKCNEINCDIEGSKS